MAVVIPQVVTEDRASGAPIIEGATRFLGAEPQTGEGAYLTRAQSGTSSTFTVSLWFKKDEAIRNEFLFYSDSSLPTAGTGIGFLNTSGQMRFYLTASTYSDQRYRDNAWYHLVASANSGVWTAYINGENINLASTSGASLGNNFRIGCLADTTGSFYKGLMTQFYCIDGQALGPEYFGFSDGLTGAWRPKKYSGTYGTNGFYLPMDGKSLLTKDMSPNGNDFTQYGMDMTVSSIEEATGAFPILKTSVSGDTGGAVRTVNKTIDVTVVSTGEGNKYFFNGVRYSPGTFPLYRGGSYTFDQSDASNGGGGTHPLRFATAEDAAGSTEYTDGVTQNGTPGQAGAYTRITVPHNAPDTLYYYCTNHGGMGGPTANTTDEVVCDPYGWKNILALPCIVNGSVGGGTAVPIDYSDQLNYGSTATSITKGSGGPNAGSADNTLNRRGLSQQGTIYYGSALHWQGGSNDSLLPGGNGDFDMGTEDFTIECWARLNGMGSSNASAFFTTATTSLGNSPYLYWGFKSNVLAVANNNFTTITSFDATPYFNKWTHYAICRNGSTIRMFANGQLMSSGTASTNFSMSNQAKIGQRYNNQNAYSLQGQMSDYRIYRGVGKYTENFTVWNPYSSNFTNAPSGVVGKALDTSDYGSWETGEFTPSLTYGAVIWPPSSDYEFDGDFTIEMFIRNKNKFSAADNAYILSANSFYRLFLGLTAEGDFDNNYFHTTNAGSRIGWSNLLRRRLRYNCWHHIAVTRESGSIRAFVDGEQIGDAYSESGTLGVGSGKLILCGYGDASNGRIIQQGAGFRGNICDLHIVKGTALYTRDFDPPTGRIQSHANTKLLTLNSSKSLLDCIQGTIHPNFGTGTAYAMWPLDSDINDDSGNNRTLTENGGSTTFISAPANNFGITNCATFTNNSKYLSYAVTPPTDGWTLDCYVYPVSCTSAPYIFGWNGTSGSHCSVGMDTNPWNGGSGNGHSPSNVFTWAIFGSPNINTYETVVFNQWAHVRVTSSDGNHLTLYINGKVVGGAHSDCNVASPITFGDVQGTRFNGHFAGVRYVEADLGAPDINNLEVTTNGVTTNSPVIRPQISCGELYSPPSQSTNNPFLEMNQVRGRSSGHAQLQALYKSGSNGVQRFLDGNLSCDLVSDSTLGYARMFIGDIQIPKTGKWYWEFYRNGTDLTVTPTYGQPYVGMCDSYVALATRESASPFLNHVSAIGGNGFGYHYGYSGTWRVGRAYSTAGGNLPIGTTMGLAYDADTGEFRVYANGEDYTQGVYDTLPTDKDWYPYAQNIYDSDDGGFRSPNNFNFGQKPFKFPPPYGYKSLCEANMIRPSAVALNPEEHHRVLLSTGANILQLCRDTFPKGLWWMKSRVSEASEDYDMHMVMNNTTGNYMSSRPWDGTTGITDAYRTYTAPTNNCVGWCWSAPESWTGATNHVANSGYRNTAAGFSMWQYTGNGTAGNTTSHGLSSAPQFMIIQQTNSNNRSVVYHHLHSANDNFPEVAPIPNYDYYVSLDNGTIYGPDVDNWNSTAPTDSLITLGANTQFNQSGGTYQAYAWHEVEGYSKFGRYAGTESSQTTTADGPYVYLGFKPSLIMIKGIGAAEGWVIRDSTRDTYNPVVKHLNQALAQESTSSFEIDFLHDGFKIRTGDGTMNYTSSGPYLYFAFAEAPKHVLYGAQPNAR